jgi:hypothetical protein
MDANPNPPLKDFTAETNWGDGTSSIDLIVASPLANVFVIANAHLYSSVGEHRTFTYVKDAGGSTLLIDPPADVFDESLTAASGPVNQVAVENQRYTGEVATFTYDNAAATAQDLTASIDWGDGSTTSGDIYQDSTGAFHVQGTHTFEQANASEPISVTVQDLGSIVPMSGFTHDPLTITGTLDVKDAFIDAKGATSDVPEGVPIASGTILATFDDPVSNVSLPDIQSVVVTWGDGSGSETLDPGSYVQIESSPDGTEIIVTAPPKVVDDSESGSVEQDGYENPVTLTMANGTVVTAANQLNSFDPVLLDPGVNVKALAGKPFQSEVSTFSTTDLKATASEFTAVVNWGDGQSTGGAIVMLGPGKFAVVGNHTYAQPGTFSISSTVHDGEGQSAADSSLATISAPALTVAGASLSIQPRKLISGSVAQFTDPLSDPIESFSAQILWGDGTTSTGTIVPGGGSGGEMTFSVHGSHAYARRKSYNGQVMLVEQGHPNLLIPFIVSVGTGRGSRQAISRHHGPRTAFLGMIHPHGPSGIYKNSSLVRTGQGASLTLAMLSRPKYPAWSEKPKH